VRSKKDLSVGFNMQKSLISVVEMVVFSLLDRITGQFGVTPFCLPLAVIFIKFQKR